MRSSHTSPGQRKEKREIGSASRSLVLGLVALVAAQCAGPATEPYFDLIEHLQTAEIIADDSGWSLSAPAATGEGGHLFLPAGSTVSYAFFAQPRSVLETERIALRGASTRLLVSVETDTGPASDFSVNRSQRRWSQALGLSDTEPVRLTLKVEANSAQEGDGALLSRPHLSGVVEPAARETVAGRREGERPNILIYLVDTLRRDRLGVYGYERPVSPELDQFTKQATLFTKSYGQSSWTKASVVSLFTGFWPPRHGVTGWGHRLPDAFETLPERLQQGGWTTAGFVTNVNAGTSFNVAQGFDFLWYKKRERSHPLTRRVLDWLNGYDGERPFFLYVHTMDPHAGYNPEEPFRSALAPTADQMKPWSPRWNWPVENAPFFSDLYDGEIAQNDAAFGALVERLRELDLYDDTLIVFTSDHGEEFLEHNGWRHGRKLYAESLDVPLVIKFPGQERERRVDVPASHIDILPTVLDVAGLEPFAEAEGQSLVAASRRPVFSHIDLGNAPLRYSVIVDPWKLIRTHREEITVELFNLADDPAETEDLSATLPVRTAAMAAMIDIKVLRGTADATDEPALSRETERELRALGYLQ